MLTAVWTADAAACDTGPFALEFKGTSSQLSDQVKGLLEYERSMLGTNKQNVIEVAFHGAIPGGTTSASKLRKDRATAIGDYLRRLGVQRYQIRVVETGKPAHRRREDRLLDSSVTVELTSGCNG